MPAGGVPCRHAELTERVDQCQPAALAVALEVESERVVLSPRELEHRRRLERDRATLHRGRCSPAMREVKGGAGGSIALDLGGEPGLEVLRFGQRAPDLL